ncbi:MAG TPA: hypothetical protein VFG62_02035, partial [Rhodopila sp.]|nr:hypothetical protein [Rhodopila sp.]
RMTVVTMKRGTPVSCATSVKLRRSTIRVNVQYARELSRWGIETSIIVPGAFTQGTNHFAHAWKPADEAAVAAYEAGPYAGLGEQVQTAFAEIVPPDADAGSVADAVVPTTDVGGRCASLSAADQRTEVIAFRFCAQASGVEPGSIGRDLP